MIIFVVSFIRTYLPPEKVRLFLAKKNKLTGHILASLLGIVTPFCSCSAVPLFLGFVEVGVPLGVTFSFLVASPIINEVALVLLIWADRSSQSVRRLQRGRSTDGLPLRLHRAAVRLLRRDGHHHRRG